MKFILNCFKGITIGAGAILPGISSGVLCVVFGIYEKLLDSILNFFKNIKDNIKFLLPILIGSGIGIILFGNLLRILFANFENQTKFCFIGIILGGIPTIFKNANSKKGFRLHYLLYTFITLIITLLLLYIENTFPTNNFSNNNAFLYLVFSGFIMSIGVVVPGISSTVLLMLLGVYDIYLLAVSTLNISTLIPMGIGLIIGGYIFLKITKYCLDNFYAQTYYSILGFVFGAIFVLYPGLNFSFQSIISIIILLISLCISLNLEKIRIKWLLLA